MMLTALLAILPLAAAAPSLPAVADEHSNVVVRETADPVHVLYRLDRASSLESVIVSNSDKSQVYGRICGNKLDTGVFADFPIAVELDAAGSGTITIGGVAKSTSACIGRNNDDEIYFDCEVPGLTLPETAILDASDLQAVGDCFATSTPALKARGAAPATSPKNADNIIALDRRQGTNCYPVIISEKVGDGNPHQNFYHKQLSENMSCGSAKECSATWEKTKSYSVGWSASINGGAWTTGGFAVQTTWSTGNSYTCTGDKNQKVCTWYKVAHTAFTVQNFFFNACYGTKTKTGGTYVIFAPNQGNKNANGGVYCRTGSNCQGQGAEFWNKAATWPGGP
ncbi:hypothetical protein QBC44DRAFT_367323 [Cladorrhinum sp. PSN332]|nr:hypothetical protein QBC44DRAFT_367323 [Cladorrhinum sp. PSN332]